MKFIFQVPSLQKIAEVKVVSELFHQEDVNTEIAKLNYPSIYPGDEVNQLENTTLKKLMIERITVLEIATSLKENLVHLISPFGLAIRKWWFAHSEIVSTLPKKFCWTQQGTVDNKKTAELVVNDENESIEIRYKMACMYCFVNEMPILWKRIPETRKKLFYYIPDRSASTPYRFWDPRDSRIFGKNLVVFWTYTVNDKVTELRELVQEKFGCNDTLYQFALKSALCGGNRSAAEFFFEKLSPEEKDSNLVKYCSILLRTRHFRIYNLEIVLFLLNQMSEEQQREVFQLHVFDVLEEMLCFPYQTFFLETAKQWFQYLLENSCHYFNLFVKICDKTMRDKNVYDYTELFRGFWQLGCADYNDFFQDGGILFKIIELCEAKEYDLVKDILKQATEDQKGQLLYFKELPFRHLPIIIRGEKWDCLKFLMEECITSKEILIKFKEYVVLRRSTEKDEGFKVRLTKALQLVDDHLHSTMEVREDEDLAKKES